MALVETFEKATRERYSTHEPIKAEVLLFERDGRKLLQIDTKGRATREMPEKVSQSLQLDENSARQLAKYIEDHFG